MFYILKYYKILITKAKTYNKNQNNFILFLILVDEYNQEVLKQIKNTINSNINIVNFIKKGNFYK